MPARLTAAIAALLLLLAPAAASAAELSYGELVDLTAEHQVTEARIDSRTGVATIAVKGEPDREIRVTVPLDAAGEVADRLHASGAKVTFRAPSSRPPITVILMLAGAIGFLIFLVVRAARRNKAAANDDGVGGVGKMARMSSAKVKDASAVRYADVAGCDEAVEELREVAEFLLDPSRFAAVGAKVPRGVALWGDPGTGKTLLAKATAGEAGASFFSVSGSDFVESLVGMGAARVRDLFKQAKASAPAIVFIDEIDAVGGKRGQHGGSDERDQTLNQLLVEMDGFDGESQVVVIAATNRLDILDPALLRPGRFTRQVHVGLPGPAGRREILAIHAAGKPLADGVDLDRMAEVTEGSSGADLANMLNEAAIMAARAGRTEIVQSDLDEGMLRSMAGPEKREAAFGEGEERKVAAHEAGHVLCAEECPTHEKALQATIKPRGRAGGLARYGRVTRMLSDERSTHERLVCLLGGRAAEREVFGVVSSGAANDLQRVRLIARQAVEQLALTEGLGQITVDEGAAPSMRERVDAEVERMVAAAYDEAQRIVADRREALDRLTELLLEHKDVDREAIAAALAGADKPSRPETAEPAAPRTARARRRRRKARASSGTTPRAVNPLPRPAVAASDAVPERS
jgi:cell division protease FtsH